MASLGSSVDEACSLPWRFSSILYLPSLPFSPSLLPQNKKRREVNRATNQQRRVAETIRDELHAIEKDEKAGALDKDAAKVRKQQLKDEFERVVSVKTPQQIKEVIKTLPAQHAHAATVTTPLHKPPPALTSLVQPPPSLHLAHLHQQQQQQQQYPLYAPPQGQANAPLYPTPPSAPLTLRTSLSSSVLSHTPRSPA